jgi:hypothetical protein
MGTSRFAFDTCLVQHCIVIRTKMNESKVSGYRQHPHLSDRRFAAMAQDALNRSANDQHDIRRS